MRAGLFGFLWMFVLMSFLLLCYKNSSKGDGHFIVQPVNGHFRPRALVQNKNNKCWQSASKSKHCKVTSTIGGSWTDRSKLEEKHFLAHFSSQDSQQFSDSWKRIVFILFVTGFNVVCFAEFYIQHLHIYCFFLKLYTFACSFENLFL